MKSLKDYSLNIPEADYHAYPAWSYSLISRYAKEGFSSIATLHEPFKPTPSMEFGSLVDCLVTYGDFRNKYTVSECTPPPAEKTLLDYLLTKTNEEFYSIPASVIAEAIETCQYRKNMKYETQYSKIEAQRMYYEERRSGKKIVSREDYNDATQMAEAIRGHALVGQYFGKPGRDNTTNMEYIYQAKFIAKMKIGDEKVDVKIMPDLLVVDHSSKTVMPFDLKTSSVPAYDFSENFIKFRYDLQASVYTDVLRAVMNNTPEYRDYEISGYTFVDISRVDKVTVAYGYDPKSESQKDGLAFKDYKYKNWRELLAEIIEYERTDAKVPSYINQNEINDLISILNNSR